eukprot:TRINITY_DN1172_c0_g1_i1.p1 TRINITY_DN1172_c0_g1~~TRINITY_DN1172_c0_g1_i1.p1  ORF type:complete len:331 (-),score=95.91 TRINITY_DN1172_c0_g1_i1:185-1177(-)
MIRESLFWETESDCPLLQLNYDFLKKDNAESMCERMTNALKSLLLAHETDVEESLLNEAVASLTLEKSGVVETKSKFERIISLDAQRTFLTEEYRVQHRTVLTVLAEKFGDYSQEIGYVAGFFLLFAPAETVIRTMCVLNFSPFYVKDYWRSIAFGYFRDALVFGLVLQEREPEVAARLKEAVIGVETFLRRWFPVFCIQLFPYENVMEIVEEFLTSGYKYLFRLALAGFQVLKGRLLEVKLTEQWKFFDLVLLSLSKKAITMEDFSLIVAKSKDIDVCNVPFDELRDQVKPEVDKRVSAFQSNDDDSDDDDEFWSSDEDEDGDGDETEE